MKILCTFVGKYGDALWALPTIRAISRRIGRPVDLMLSAPFASICPLLELQPYIGQCWAYNKWEPQDTAPMTPREPPDLGGAGAYDLVLDLSYREWPDPNVALHTFQTATLELNAAADCGVLLPGPNLWSPAELDLQTPWIAPIDKFIYRWSWVYGFTDEWFELKVGIVRLLEKQPALRIRGTLPPCSVGGNPRWMEEAGDEDTDWITSASYIQHSYAFLGCCSALHVLAVACGTPAVVVEPSPMRHHPCFWPLGTDGPQVYGVRGNDGLLTFDARATRALLEQVLILRKAAQPK